jgi:3-phenylpropionate/cinnamic acid dioxygenase small subunit
VSVALDEKEISDFVLEEAELLDRWRLNEWLELFTDDGIYWVAMEESADPRTSPSITYDDRKRRAMRVDMLMSQSTRAAQAPRSETVHVIGNVRISPDGADAADVRYNVIIAEIRQGDWRIEGIGQQRFFAGRCELKLQKTTGWRIRQKKLVLLNRHKPIENLTFII